MSFFQEYTVLDPSGQTVGLFPSGPYGPSGNKLRFVLQDLKLYIPSKTHDNVCLTRNQKIIWNVNNLQQLPDVSLTGNWKPEWRCWCFVWRRCTPIGRWFTLPTPTSICRWRIWPGRAATLEMVSTRNKWRELTAGRGATISTQTKQYYGGGGHQ